MQYILYELGVSLAIIAGGMGCIILLKQLSGKQEARWMSICVIFFAVPGLMLVVTSRICEWDTDLCRKIVLAICINLVIVLATVVSWFWKEFKW